MIIRFLKLMPILAALLTGCSTMNSNFSCNKTAGDSCLTIEQVDAMTHFADDLKPYPPRQSRMKAEQEIPKQTGRILKQANGQSLWVARHPGGQAWA
jgi:conjugal transfer pilus assembly protein TraV